MAEWKAMTKTKYQATDKPKSAAQVNAYFKMVRGFNPELRQGNGYYYFANEKVFAWAGSSVMVTHVDQLTFAEWVAEWDEFERKNV